MSLPSKIAVIVLTPGGADLARRLTDMLPVEIHGPGLDRPAERIAALFAEGQAIVGICAAGILIRAVAPLLADKRAEPPVLALAEDGSAVVPLLGGHHGGNVLARLIAERLGIAPSITTAGDLRLGLSLDEPPPGWRIANPDRIKPIAAALIAGAAARIEGEVPWLDPLRRADDGSVGIRVTASRPAQGETALIYHPPMLALGVGCERGCDPGELETLVRSALDEAGLAADAVACVVSADLKADEPAVQALAERLGVPARFFSVARLAEETDRLANPSETVFREIGCWGVAEGAALAAAGPQGTLIVPKRKSARATAAIALAPAPLDPAAIGQARGRLDIIGIGPGSAEWRTPEATAALRGADHLVGYGLYLDLLGDLAQGKQRHETGLGDETGRARCALDLAAAGGRVALISSGDAGIYGLATLVFELLEREAKPEWRRVEIVPRPGLSALQAAAARAGAPLGHDFCAISLSDLMTPWPAIEKRLEAAAAADFVVALYNPRSERRRDQLVAAKAIFLAHRPPETPVLLARNLGRAGETITIVDLAAFEPDEVDMLTLVMIGASTTRRVPGTKWIYTPRGYGDRQR
ncbi:MAG TPA: precorrin-3B C(17)-methyltransferase [Aliidongia sp.]|nr:precorrin-3B C(17)-methyltransferase [Aliidongia sp.]